MSLPSGASRYRSGHGCGRGFGKTCLAFSIAESRRSAYYYASEAWQRFAHRLALGRISTIRFAGATPERLVVAPIDLRIADPHIATEIYSGRFALGGTQLDTGGASPFQMPMPNESFARSLHGFGWLRHMRAADHDLAFSNARSLVDDWISTHGRDLSGFAYRQDVLASRLIAWFSHSPVVLRGADHGFYRRFLKSIALQVRYLRHVAHVAPDGETRFRVRIALAMSSLCLPAGAGAVKTAARLLDVEFERQILPDGGHISRNPQVLVELLTDLLPLRQTYVNLGQKLPGRMIAGIDRMFSALRFFRHANGEIALFNGASTLSADRLLAVLRYDESAGVPYREAPHSHFQRLASRGTVVITDTGTPPPGALSRGAHAGCLSFEFSSGANRFIVNAGAPVHASPAYASYARLTAAHSTLVLDDQSSLSFSRSGFLGAIVVGGVRRVEVAGLDEAENWLGFAATHDGYLDAFGKYHCREIRLLANGAEIHGRDRVMRPGDKPIARSDASVAVVRFHVNPKIAVEHHESGAIYLTAQDGERWAFVCPDVPAEVEEDVHFADIAGPRASRQITLTFSPAERQEVSWSFSRIALPRG
jgi:Uncharacterized protein conserved in bacteria